jgi:hypothetical protein
MNIIIDVINSLMKLWMSFYKFLCLIEYKNAYYILNLKNEGVIIVCMENL